MLEPHIHIPSQRATTWAGRIVSEDKREDTCIQIRRWKSCAMHSQDAGRGEHDWMKWGKRAVYNAGQGWALLSKGSACTNRKKHREACSIWQVFQLFPVSLSLCLQLRYIWQWLDMRVLQEWQLFHIICPWASSSLCQGEGGQSFGCLLYRTSLTAGQKEAVESPSHLQNLQQEEF